MKTPPNSTWTINTLPNSASYTWGTTTGSNNITTWDSTMTHPNLMVKGDATIKGNLTVQGKNILEVLEKIEKRLGIVTRNLELEERWAQLKEVAEQYEKLEQDLLDKEKVWNILNK